MVLSHAAGNLAGADDAPPPPPSRGATVLELAGAKPVRPSKDLFQENCINCTDAWARVYLARGCGAVVHSGYAGGKHGDASVLTEMFFPTIFQSNTVTKSSKLCVPLVLCAMLMEVWQMCVAAVFALLHVT